MGWDSDIYSIFVIYHVYYSYWKQSFGLAQINLASVNQESQPKKKKLNSLKLDPKQREKLVLGLAGKTQNLKNIPTLNHSNHILYIILRMWLQKWDAVL